MAYSNVRSRSFGLIKSALAIAGILGASGLSAPAAIASSVLADGTYLYSQSVSSQPGDVYMVLEVNDTRTVGAFYMHSSSFDCFYGGTEPGRLSLTVVDSYDQTAHPYAIATEATAALVAGQGATSAVVPAGFTEAGPLSELASDVLATCQTSYGDSI